jgi:hypothetical protein
VYQNRERLPIFIFETAAWKQGAGGSDMLKMALPFAGTIGIVLWTKQVQSTRSVPVGNWSR